ncbi:MAG: TonB-dependent receptor [Ignavibacteriales bacterium]|nr:TonB-dependent receptor [Ignavibacteriales bacterium]
MINRYTLLSFFMLLLVTFTLMQSNVFAQGVTTAAMNGIVVDSKGDPLPGANILAVHTPSGTQYGTTSRVDGKYNLNGLRTGGPYKVTVSFVGYKPQVFEGQNLQLGQNAKLDYTLYEEAVELGDITVVGDKNAVISSNRTGAGQNVTAKDIELLPTINRSFQDFAKLSPQSSGNSSSFASRNNRYNNIQIDGTQYNDIFGLGASGTPGGQSGTTPISLDAIDQFQVVVAPYDVKYGGFTGGGINAITRSGTNKFKGSLYGFGRNESLIGDGTYITDNPATSNNEQKYPEFKEYQYGFRLGGPIVKDKLFFFVSGEIAARDLPLSNISLSTGADTLKTLASRFEQILKDQGMDPGTQDAFTTEQPSNKFFIRLDLNQSENHKITLRHNYVGAYRDILDGRNSNNTLSFSTLAYRIRNVTNSTVLQINSTNNENISNEFILGFTSIRDRRAGITEARPEIRVFESAGTLIAGPDRFSSANELDQDILELTDNLSFFAGDHVITVGTHNEFFSFRNLFMRSVYGYYEFANLTALENGTPRKTSTGYERSISKIPGVDLPAAQFSVNQLGFYLQDEWTIIPTLKATFGVRVDIPFLPTEPGVNDSVSKYFDGYSTGDVPSGNLMVSPRFGFNWDLFGDRTTQIRGGVGIFTGRVPYVWMSNNYGNTGLLLAQIGQNTSNSAPYVNYNLDPYNQPGPDNDPTGTTAATRSEINMVDPDFKFPQILRANIGVDQELPWGMIGTLELMYSQSINDLVYEKLNIGSYSSPTNVTGEDRPRYGGTLNYNNNFNDVLLLKNTDEGYSYNLTAQLQRNVDLGLSFNTAYTYGVSQDVNSVLSSQAQSQIRFNPISVDPNKPSLTTSSFDLGHRLFASVSYSHEFFTNSPTTISFYYNYQSGRPYSFTVSGDVNNDGFNGNDLFYIPENQSDILLGTATTTSGVTTYTPAAQSMYDDLFAFIDNNEYLAENKGKMTERNATRNPWTDVLDVRVAQAFSTPIGNFQVSLDILNFMNLLSSEWGLLQTTPQDTYNMVTLQGIETATGKAIYRFTKPANNTPWSPSDLASRWQMQLGLRYSF